jgi:hypothetical protein
MKQVLAFCLLAAFTTSANAQALFKEYSYGMSEKTIHAIEGTYLCDGRFYCLDDQTFMDEPVGLIFNIEDRKLATVLLDLSGASNPLDNILLPLLKSEMWMLVLLHNPSAATSLDIIERHANLDTSSPSTFEIGATAAGSVGYSLIELTDDVRDKLKGVKSTNEVLRRVKADTRFIDIFLNDNEGSYYMNFYHGARAFHAPTKEIEAF